MSRLFTRMAVSLLLVLFWGAAAAADYKDDIGYTQLQTELGGNTPTGNGVPVTQVEADVTPTNPDYYSYLPDTSQFFGKTFTLHRVYKDPLHPVVGTSGHATGVGQLFYGSSSIAPGITSISNYLADHWLDFGFLNTGSASLPRATSDRVANHSWVGASSDPDVNVEVLKRLDWVIDRDEYIQVVAMGNGGNNSPLMGSSFNAIAVGLSSGTAGQGSYPLATTPTTPYASASRTRPDLVAPADLHQ